VVTGLVATAVLFGATVVCEKALATRPREDPLGRQLLYLPSPEMLRLASLGNPGLVADLVYLWSIQYYSQFQPHERFMYLETVYNLITDLDPLYHDAYRVGALIMQIQTGDDETYKQAVIRLFDKALERMPLDHEIAEAAAWDMVIRYRDMDQAIRYIEMAIAIPGSPHRLKRALAAWRDKEGGWSFEDALAYWQEARQDAISDYDTAVCDHQIYRLYAARDEEKLNPILMKYAGLHGGCPDDWQKVIDVGWVREVPVDYFGNPYRIVPESCSARAIEEVP
jgi:tetratricopeptide (TPR) repeat protein